MTAVTGEAAGGAQVSAGPTRSIELITDSWGFDHLEVRLYQRTGTVTASTSGGNVGSMQWVACVHGHAKHGWISGCNTPRNLKLSLPTPRKTGRLSFDVNDDFWDATANVRLSLGKSGTPSASYTLDRRGTLEGIAAGGAVASAREAPARGYVRVTAGDGKKRSQRKHSVGAGEIGS